MAKSGGAAHVRPGRIDSGAFHASGPESVPSHTSGYAAVWLASVIRRHSSHATDGTTRAAAQTSVMLIAYQMPPRVPSPNAPDGGQRRRAPSGDPARGPASIVARSARALSGSAAPQRIAHGWTSNQQSPSPTMPPPGA